jgi:hypothetical protein
MTRRITFAGLAVFLAVPTISLAQSELGIWKLNPAKMLPGEGRPSPPEVY